MPTLRRKTTTTSGLTGCVPTHEGDTACSTEKLTLAAVANGLGTSHTVAVQDTANVVLRRYRFASTASAATSPRPSAARWSPAPTPLPT